MNLYEGMFVLPETMEEDAVEDAVKKVGKEIERLGGEIESTARLGKRKFARPIAKQDYGYYVVMTFELEGGNVRSLKKRYGLRDDLLRAQIVRVEDEDVGTETAAGAASGKNEEARQNDG